MKRIKALIMTDTIRNNEEGATAIEFAFLALPLFTLIIGILEFGIIMFVQSALDNSMNTASRLGITGDNYEGVALYDTADVRNALPPGEPLTREFLIRETINRLTFGLIDTNRLEITCESLGRGSVYNTTNTSAGTTGCDLGEPGDVVIYNAGYEWDFATPLIGNIFDTIYPEGYRITSALAVTNEDTSVITTPN